MRRADTALGQGRFDVAQSIYDSTLRSNPNLSLSPWRCRNIAEAYIRATHPNLRAGADWLQKAVDQAPNDTANRERLASVLLQLPDPDSAANQYRYLLRSAPDNQNYVLGLATALRDSGEYDDAVSVLNSALEKHPTSAALRVEYGRNLTYQRKYDAAKDQYQQVLQSDPNNVEAQIGLAKLYSWQGNQQQALVQYQKALVKDPGNYDALVGQAFALIWSGRQGEAMPMLERANTRHPENVEVREALKRLGSANIFSGEVRAGEPEWPILAPSMKKAPERSRESGSSTPAAQNATSTTTATQIKAETPATTPHTNTSPSGHSVMWVVAMGLLTMVGVFAVAGFLLYFLPNRRTKVDLKAVVEARPPELNPVEQWARLEEFSRPRVRKEPKSYRPQTANSNAIPLSELLPAPTQSDLEAEREPEAAPSQQAEEKAEPAMAASVSAPDESAQAALKSLASDKDTTAPRPRRRRGQTDRPWWRDLSNPDLPLVNQESTESPSAPAVAPEVFSLPEPPHANTFEEATIVVPSDRPNPLTPASEKPPLPEEPPPARPFTMVLSRALERAGDGQAEENADPKPPEPEENDDYVPSGNGKGKVAPVAPVYKMPANDAEALNDSSIVIVGCGVMVSHYRALLRAAGADVRTFTFWDLAMSSMRKRRADVLLIDGDALDGLTPTQMFTSAQVERYMFGAVLVGVSSDEDRSALPEEVMLAHSLSDDDLRNRFIEALQAS
ncbi:MAG: tetratricopeptide repeat protein [Acidobacteriaceae bacterium]